MFGIQKFALKVIGLVLGIIVGGIVVISIATTVGCMPNNGTELSQSQMALATKNNIDSSQEDNRQDNSIVLELPELEVVGPKLPPVNSNADEMAKLVNARGDEREKIILANAALQEKVIRAEEEKYRILAYGIIASIILLVGFWLYLKQSPWDGARKQVD